MKYLRHVIAVALLFGLILAVPAIIDALKAPKETVTEAARMVEETRPEPSQPRPAAIPVPMPGNRMPPPVNKTPHRTPQVGMGVGNDTLIIGGGNGVQYNLTSGMADGGGGKDTFMTDGAGTASLDGMHIRSFEFFKLQNHAPNILYVFQSGLDTLESGDVFVDGDPEDIVRLDPSLKWYPPVKDGRYMRYNGTDGATGHHYSANVMFGVQVETGAK